METVDKILEAPQQVEAAHTHGDGTVHSHADSAMYTHADGTVHSHADSAMHTHADGTVHSHGHGSVPHAHVHDPAEKKRQLNRLSRAIGHMQYVKRMIENDEDCSQVLIQIAAIQSALNGLGKQIIEEHITHCITHAMEDGDMRAIEEFKQAIQKFI